MPDHFPIQTKTDVVMFIFHGGIPTSEAAAKLKFGLEALPGVESVHFVECDGIEVAVDSDRAGMELLWEGIVQAGFQREAVVLSGGTLSLPDAPAEITVEAGEAQTDSSAAA
jgi:hypothetical protein